MHKTFILHQVLAYPLDAQRCSLAYPIPRDVENRKIVVLQHAFENGEAALPFQLIPMQIQFRQMVITLDYRGEHVSDFIGQEVL